MGPPITDRWPAQAAWLLCCGGTQLALPATAAAADVGKLFDIDATLPIVMLQVLLLTFLLDRILFGPVGRHLDARKVALDGKRADAKRLAARAAEFKVLLVTYRRLRWGRWAGWPEFWAHG